MTHLLHRATRLAGPALRRQGTSLSRRELVWARTIVETIFPGYGRAAAYG